MSRGRDKFIDDRISISEEIEDQSESRVLTGGKIVLAMPILYHVEPETFDSVMIATSRFGREHVRFMSEKRTLVHEGRNRLVHRFLHAADADYILFLDGDMLFPCGHAPYFNKAAGQIYPARICEMNFIERMLSHGPEYAVIGGTYFDRVVGRDIQCSRGVGNHAEANFTDRYHRGEITGISEVLWTATGCMRIHRNVFETIAKNIKRFPEIDPVLGNRIGFFHPARTGIGEDVSFCARARACGFKIWQDWDLRCLHKGVKFH